MFITDKEALKWYTEANRVWQGIPSIERTDKGRLFATFYSGYHSETFGNYVLLFKSDDDGKSWGEPIVAIDKPETVRYYDPNLWIDPLGRLWFIWQLLPTEKYGIYAAICDNPDADTLEWGESFFIAPELMINKPTVLSTGEWLFPVSVLPPKATIMPRMCAERIYVDTSDNGAFVYKTTDCGKTFVKLGKALPPNRQYDEHMVVELKNGVLMMLIRTTRGIYKSYSYDSGHNWNTPVLFDIPNPSTRFHIRRLKSGKLMLINNSHEDRKRINLTVHLSSDEGNTWSEGFVIDSRTEVSYPDAKESDDGFIYIIYDRERGSHKKSLDEAYACAREILMAKVSEEDVIAGKLVNPESKLRCIISKLNEYTGERDFYANMEEDIAHGICNILLSLDKREDMVNKIMQYYLPSSSQMATIDVKKADKLIFKILNEEENLEKNLKALIKVFIASPSSVESSPVLERITDFIEKNFAEEWSLEEFADEMGMSMYYMCRIFKDRTGISILNYRNDLRLKKAKELLFKTDKSVSDISVLCGFNSQSYFVKKFREAENITPLQYREKMKIN